MFMLSLIHSQELQEDFAYHIKASLRVPLSEIHKGQQCSSNTVALVDLPFPPLRHLMSRLLHTPQLLLYFTPLLFFSTSPPALSSFLPQINTTEAEEISVEMGVDALPTIQFYRGRKMIGEFKGSDIAVVDRVVRSHVQKASAQLPDPLSLSNWLSIVGCSRLIQPAVATLSPVVIVSNSRVRSKVPPLCVFLDVFRRVLLSV